MSVDFKNCVVLFGGSSEERLVSVASAQNLAAHLPEASFWYWGKDDRIFVIGQEELKAHQNAFTTEFVPKVPAGFPSMQAAIPTVKNKFLILGLHGTQGEDGKLQALLEQHQIKFTGSDARASALAFDKRATKHLAKTHGISVVTDLAVSDFSAVDEAALAQLLKDHGKIVLKPLANGSSVGLFIIGSGEELTSALNSIKTNGKIPYMAEPFITGREITVGVWQKSPSEIIPLPCSEVRITQGGQFDYQGKYLGKGVEEITPAELTSAEASACQAVALKVHQIIGCKGYTRTDMVLTKSSPVLLEINTLPGLTRASFIPQQLQAINVNLREFFEAQLKLN